MKNYVSEEVRQCCDCGHPDARWHGDTHGLRTFCCDACYERPALLACAAALQKLWAVYRDLSKTNPGFLGKLGLQDYAQYNEAMCETPTALAELAEVRLHP